MPDPESSGFSRPLLIAILLAVTLFGVAVFGIETAPTVYEEPVTLATSTLAVVANATSTVSLPVAPATTSATQKPASAPKKKTALPAPTISAAAPAPSTTIAAEAPVSQSSLDTAAAALRGALVNIVCYAPAGSRYHSISGSGVIIDPKGIILTNAHVAQYFLLADQGMNCGIRTGNPAQPAYKALLMYISPAWLKANSTAIAQAAPTGTGEHDFALLAIEGSLTQNPLPALFPSIPLATEAPLNPVPVVIASYGAQFLEANQIQNDLFPTVVFGSVKQVYTFDTNTADVMSLGGSAAAQEGSSGGGVASGDGLLIGTITTSTVEGSTDTRTLDAITAAYIRRDYAADTGNTLESLLDQPTLESITDFSPQISVLEKLISLQ